MKHESVDPTMFIIPKLLILVQPERFNNRTDLKNLAGDVTNSLISVSDILRTLTYLYASIIISISKIGENLFD